MAEIVSLLDIAIEEKGLLWVDELRKQNDGSAGVYRDGQDDRSFEQARRLLNRNFIWDGHALQYQFLSEQKMRPSELRVLTGEVDKALLVDETLLLVSDDVEDLEAAA